MFNALVCIFGGKLRARILWRPNLHTTFATTQIGLLSGLLTIGGPPEIDYAATEALIEAEGGKHVRAKDGR